MKKRNSFAILTVASGAILGLASCGPNQPTHTHNYQLHNKVEPTCLAEGQEAYYTCDGCEKLFNENKEEISQIVSIPASAHVPQHHNGVAPTCTEPGKGEYWTCENTLDEKLYGDAECKTVIGEVPVVPAKGHAQSLTHHDQVAATCMENGIKEYWECPDCNIFFSDDAAQNLIGDATALADWKTAAGKILAKGHDTLLTKIDEIPATCFGSGVKEHYKCESCAEYFEDSAAKKHIEDLAAWKAGKGSIPATGNHVYDYDNKKVTWEDDMATVVAKCETQDCIETISETKQGSYVKDTDSTCTAPEKGHYKVTFDNTNFGSAQTAPGSVEKGEPHAHTYGDLVPEVDANRETAGMKAYYKCSECNGYFDADKNPTTEANLVIPAPARSFSANTNFDWDFKTPIAAGSTITMDLKFVDGDANSKIVVQLFGAKDDGSCDWSNCFGAFSIFSDRISDNPAGVSLMKCDDGYVRVTFVLDSITKKSGTPNGVAKIFFDGRYTNVGGYIEVNSNVAAHTKGAELIPAKAPVHSDDGYQAHYECTGCDDYWFNESGALCKKEDLTIASNAIKYAPPAEGKTMAEFKNLGNLTDKFWIDIHFDNPTKHQELGFNFYESAWDNYYGIFWVDCDEKGVYFEGDYTGLELAELEDGWWRLNVYPAALNKFVKDKEIDQKRSIDFIYVQGPGTVSNRGSGMMEFMPDYDKVLPSAKVYSISGGDSYAIERIFSRGDKISLDIQIKNDSQANIVLMQNWDTVVKFNVTAAGTILDQTNGVQIFKLNNEAEGYPTLDGTWYRIIVDLAWATLEKGMENYTYINRIGGNKWNVAEFDMMINSPYTTDGWYTITGGSSNTKIQFKIPTPLAIRDGDGQLFDKALYFEVKAVGTGKAYVSPMDYDWHNCGKYVLTFTDGVLTDRVVQGSANKWPKVTDLGNGVYGLTLALSQLPGDGLANASSIGFFYNGDGVLANGLSEFSINVLSLKLVEIPA